MFVLDFFSLFLVLARAPIFRVRPPSHFLFSVIFIFVLSLDTFFLCASMWMCMQLNYWWLAYYSWMIDHTSDALLEREHTKILWACPRPSQASLTSTPLHRFSVCFQFLWKYQKARGREKNLSFFLNIKIRRKNLFTFLPLACAVWASNKESVLNLWFRFGGSWSTWTSMFVSSSQKSKSEFQILVSVFVVRF